MTDGGIQACTARATRPARTAGSELGTAKHTVVTPVHEIDDEADRHPHDEPDPGIERQTSHHREADDDAEDRDERHHWRPERTLTIGLVLPQPDHTATDDHEGEEGADRYQLAEQADRKRAGDERADD